MIHNDVHQKLVDMAAERGWNEETQIAHLCGFLQEIHDDHQTSGMMRIDYLGNWEDYLENAAEDEDKETENANQYVQSLEAEPEAVCENCEAPCEYDSEICLCPKCEAKSS
jgi:hypothetical protein